MLRVRCAGPCSLAVSVSPSRRRDFARNKRARCAAGEAGLPAGRCTMMTTARGGASKRAGPVWVVHAEKGDGGLTELEGSCFKPAPMSGSSRCSARSCFSPMRCLGSLPTRQRACGMLYVVGPVAAT